MAISKSSQSKSKKSDIQSNTAGIAIVQWLSYALWGAVVIATASLIGIITNFMLNGYTSNYESIAYVIAAALVLFPLAIVCEVIFSKYEKDHKTAAGAVIMVIHAVLFTLIAVGALATFVFSLVSMALSDTSDVNGSIVAAVTSISVFVMFGLLVLRAARPVVGSKLRLTVRFVLSVIALGVIVWGLAGPVAQTFMRKDDDRAVSAAQSLGSYISYYAGQNRKLPVDIEQAVANSDDGQSLFGESGQELVLGAAKDGLIRYTPHTKTPSVETIEDGSMQTSYFYELCVVFDYADKNRNLYNQGYLEKDSFGYTTGIPQLSTEAGDNCYSVRTLSYNDPIKPKFTQPQ